MIKTMRSRISFVLLGLAVGLLGNAIVAFAWSGPPASAPTCPSGSPGCDAPINVGTTAQTKNGDVGVNNFTAFGTLSATQDEYLVGASKHINFNVTAGNAATMGDNGYGIRDFGGTLQYKNSGQAWTNFGGTNLWTSGAGGAIYYNGGNVGIGTASPTYKLDVRNTGDANLRVNDDTNSRGMVLTTNQGGLAPAIIWNVANNNNWQIYNSGGTLGFYESPANVYAMTLLSNGHVGIGNTSPAQIFSVRGNPGNTWLGEFYNAAGSYGIYGEADGAGGSVGVAGYVSSSGGNGTYGVNRYYDSSGYLGSGVHGVVGYGGDSNAWGDGVVGYGRSNDSQSYGVYGQNGSYWGALGRGDGYSFVGTGSIWTTANAYAASFIYNSDRRLKDNIQNLDRGLVTLMQLRPVSFTWNGKDGMQHISKNDIGFIAQEVQPLVPEAVTTNQSSGYMGIDYPKLIPILVKSIQEQEGTIEKQQAQINSLEERIAQLEAKSGQ